MSRTSSLITSYLQALIFAALAVRCIAGWLRDRDRRSAHLAWASALFASTSLIGAITSTFIDATNPAVAAPGAGGSFGKKQPYAADPTQVTVSTAPSGGTS